MVAVRNTKKHINKLIVKIFKFFILSYQFVFSPMLHAFSISTVGGGCRFYPTCSEYSKQVINKYGVNLTSGAMIFYRIVRCQPINFFKNKKNSGYDPVK